MYLYLSCTSYGRREVSIIYLLLSNLQAFPARQWEWKYYIYEWSSMWWSGVVFVVNVWCELWAWWTWGHLPNCHNLLSLIDFQLSLKSSKQSTSDLTTTPTPTQSSHLSSFLQRIFPQQLIDIYWLAGCAGQSSPRRPGRALLLYEMYTSRVKNNFNEIIINIPGL